MTFNVAFRLRARYERFGGVLLCSNFNGNFNRNLRSWQYLRFNIRESVYIVPFDFTFRLNFDAVQESWS